MKSARFFVLVMLVLVCVIGTACEGSTANIASATLAKGYQDKKAVDPTTTFAPTDTIHAVVEVANAPDDTKVKGVWTIIDAVDASGAAVKDAKLGETEYVTKDIGTSIDFTFQPNQPLPIGKYKAEIYLNDKLDKTLEFEVVE
jgi:hypothetical protein